MLLDASSVMGETNFKAGKEFLAVSKAISMVLLT